ncbi:MAG TPA: hypothetical protein VFJ63_04875 [Candidatus Bathyarchaeia archaeon]|nr:hypothetical protein [Candidatus Bathyarchaeia archaeon]
MRKFPDAETEQLAKKWQAHMHAFPAFSGTVQGKVDSEERRAIVNLHGNLAEWDGYNAGLVRRIIDGQKLEQSGFVFAPDPELGQEIDHLISRYPQHADLFAAYKKEYDEMLDMIELASKINRRR